LKSQRVIISLFLISFLVPLSVFNFPFAKGATTSVSQTCPQSSAETMCDFYYPDFATTTGLVLNGNALQASGSILRLTPNALSQAGSAWYNLRENVTEGFRTTFRFQITPAGGGDGFAFVIQNSNTTALGTNGQGLGYDGITRSLAVEFDTYQNTNLNDISDHEIAVHTNDLGRNSASEFYALPPGPVISPVHFQLDPLPHAVEIVYTLGVLEIFIDDFSSPVLAVSVNLKPRLGLVDGTAYVGFTGSTGLQADSHDILDWAFLTHVPSSNIVQNGDFSSGLLGWTPVRSTIVHGTRGEYPIFQTLAGMPAPSICTPVGRRGTSFVAIDTPFGASGYIEQQVKIPSSNAHLTLVSWGWENNNLQFGTNGATNASVVVVDQVGIQHILESFIPPPMLNVIDPSNPATDTCTGNIPTSKSYDLSAFAGQIVKVRLASQSNNCCGTLTVFADVDVEAPGIAVFQCPALAGFKAALNSCALPNASPGQSYSYQLPITGGVPPYDVTIASGMLPLGLTLETNGDIHGTTTGTGVFPLNLTIQDNGLTPPISISITITVPPIITAVTPAAGPVGGGTALNITGIGFSKVNSVSFNSTSSGFQINSDTSIHVGSTPHSQSCVIPIILCHDVPGIDNVTVNVGSYPNSFWCSAPDPVSLNAQEGLRPGCNHFTYLPNADDLVCSSSAPGGLIPLFSFRDDNIRFRASLDASLALADAELSGSIAIAPKAGYCLHLSGGQIKSFNFTTVFDYSADLSANVSLTAQYDNLNKPFVLAGPFQTAPLIAGPIIIVPTITPVLMVNASATGAISGAVSYNSETTSSLTFTASTSKWNNTSSTVCKPDPITGQVATLSTLCLQPTSVAMTVRGSVKVELGLQFSLLLYDIAGPVVTPDLYLRLDGGYSISSTTNGPRCDGLSEGTQPGGWGAMCAGLEVAVGAQLNPLLDFLLPTSNWTAATFDLKSVLLAGSITATLSNPNVTLQTDGTFKLSPGESISITTTVAGTALPTSLTGSSSWNPSWVAPSCGTFGQTSPGTFLYTAPSSGGVCTVEFTKSFLALNIWTKETLSFRTTVHPLPPQGLTAELQSSASIVLSWQAPQSDGGSAITGYIIYRSEAPGQETFLAQVGPVTSYTDSSVSSGTTYYYKVAAINSVGTSAPSDGTTINFSPPSSPSPTPSPPPTNTGSSFPWIFLYITVGAVIALLGTVTALLFTRRKPKI
jgi:hypothetical protein